MVNLNIEKNIYKKEEIYLFQKAKLIWQKNNKG
jgi:hypothetical protein